MGEKKLFIGIFPHIWHYLGLTLSSLSFKFFKISLQRQRTFNFHQNKNVFNQQILFLSNFFFSSIKVLYII